MNKRIISKVGKRNRPEIDMMEYMQTQETIEFDLDKHVSDGAKFTTIKKKYVREDVEIEHNAEFSEEIENNEV